MMKIPLECYRSPVGPHAVVELDDEGGRVRLVLELEPRELTGSSWQRVEDHVDLDAVALASSIDEDPNVVRIRDLEADLLRTSAVLNAVRKHRDHLRERLERVADEQEVARDLTPSEAREVAAALWHYAHEADSWTRRP